MAYYIALFSPATYSAFTDSGRNISGFSERWEGKAANIKPGLEETSNTPTQRDNYFQQISSLMGIPFRFKPNLGQNVKAHDIRVIDSLKNRLIVNERFAQRKRRVDKYGSQQPEKIIRRRWPIFRDDSDVSEQ